ncbi:Cytochrome c1 heme lyase [Hypoxylon texense]
MEDQEKPFPFQCLPPELRNMIYKFILQKDVPFYFHRNGRLLGVSGHGNMMRFDQSACVPGSNQMARMTRSLCRQPQPSNHTALLRTCKQVYKEASHVLFTANMVFINPVQTTEYLPLYRSIVYSTRLILWIDDSALPLLKDLRRWQRHIDAYRIRAWCIHRLVVLFETNIWMEVQRLTEEQHAQFWAAFEGDPRKLNTIDVGYYPTIIDAFKALKEAH